MMCRFPRLLALALACLSPGLAFGQSRTDLKRLSLDELLNIDVTTISRREESWWAAPSGIDVITGNDIRRAGVRNLPDALRLATGVHVGQPSARSWAVSIRGMNVLAANKISVLMDGRSLFTPFFSGVHWDAQDTLLDDIDRIEVVRGPVGALWGAFAVNGFVQILTKSAFETQGYLASAGAGTEDPFFGSFRYGGSLGPDTAYRVYAKYFQTEWTYDRNGNHPQDATDFFQAGFRVDARRAENTTITLQGDFYTNRDLPLDRPQGEAYGGNFVARWKRQFTPDSDLQFDGYIDRTFRLIPTQFEERRTTASVSAKYHLHRGNHDWLVGTDALLSWDDIANIGPAQLVPASRRTHTLGAYALDTVRLTSDLHLTVAVKGEHNAFSGFEWQPTGRLAWTPTPQTTVWSAISRAVRTPVRVDEDLVLAIPGFTLFEAQDDFKTETAMAYELGVRHRLMDTITLDSSAFIYNYDHLRSTEPAGAADFPMTFKNGLNAESAGVEVTAMMQPASWLFLKASYRYLDLDFTRDPGTPPSNNGNAEGNDARHVGILAAHFDITPDLEFDAFLRHVSELPDPAVPAYTTADLRLGWRPTEQWEFSLCGRNLFRPMFAEFATTNSLNEYVRRSVTGKITWRY